MTAHNSKQKCEKLAAVVGAPQTTQNLVISRCCFAEDGNLLFSDFLVVVVLVWLSSLMCLHLRLTP